MTLLLRTGGTLWSEIGVLFLIISGHFDILFPKIPTGFIQFSQIGVLEGFNNEYLWKYNENQRLNKRQYHFANISTTEARIFLESKTLSHNSSCTRVCAQIFTNNFMVVHYYLMSLRLSTIWGTTGSYSHFQRFWKEEQKYNPEIGPYGTILAYLKLLKAELTKSTVYWINGMNL